MKVTTVMTDGILSKVSFETESISENIIDVIQDFLYQQLAYPSWLSSFYL